MYGDPHFSVPLLHGGKLCYSVQGIPGLSFNLLSSKHFIINSMFIDSVNDPTQVTWIGKLAVILKSTTKPKPIIFDSVTQSVKIEGNGYFKPQFLQQIVINNTDSITVRATHGLNKQTGNPSVTVLLNNPKASFDVIFHKDHLDVNWKMQDDEIDGCHGLLGQQYTVTQIHTYACTHIHMCVYACTHTNSHTNTYIHVCTRTHTHTHMHEHAHVHTHTYTHTHTQTQTHTHTQTQTHTHTSTS